MSKHVHEWLNAYHDNELYGSHLQQVEAHLAECPICQAELEALEKLTSLLDEVPAPEFTSPERFAAQVNLRLPRRQMTAPGKKILEIGWWMVPVGLLVSWVFVSTSFLVGEILSTANNLGLLTGVSNWLTFGPVNETDVSAALGQFGILSGNGLDWAASLEALTRTSMPMIIFQVSIALLYLSWIAIWWARRTRHARQPRGQLLES